MGKKNAETTETTDSKKTRGPKWNVAVQGLRPDTGSELNRLAADFAMASVGDPSLADLAKAMIQCAKDFAARG